METVEVEQITLLTLCYFILKQLSCFPFFLISNHLSHLKQINSWGGYVLRAFIWSLLPGKLLLLSVCVLKLTDSVDCFVTSDDKRQQGPTSLHVVSEQKNNQRLSQHWPRLLILDSSSKQKCAKLCGLSMYFAYCRLMEQILSREWVGEMQCRASIGTGESSAGGQCVR